MKTIATFAAIATLSISVETSLASKVPTNLRGDRHLKGSDNNGMLADGECAFIFNLARSIGASQIQVDNGVILDYEKKYNPPMTPYDTAVLATCDSTKCFGDTDSLTFIASGECEKEKDAIRFTMCEETLFSGRHMTNVYPKHFMPPKPYTDFQPMYVSCPRITDIASADCEEFDIGSGAIHMHSNVTLTAEGSIVEVLSGEPDVCYMCEVTCTHRNY